MYSSTRCSAPIAVLAYSVPTPPEWPWPVPPCPQEIERLDAANLADRDVESS
jgi:hypothetical protein